MTALPAGAPRHSAAWIASDYWEMAKRRGGATMRVDASEPAMI